MRHTIAIVAIVFIYMWVADPLVNVDGPWVALPVMLILAIGVRHDMKSGDWGFSRRAFWPALAWSIALTVPLERRSGSSVTRRERRRHDRRRCWIFCT